MYCRFPWDKEEDQTFLDWREQGPVEIEVDRCGLFEKDLLDFPLRQVSTSRSACRTVGGSEGCLDV